MSIIRTLHQMFAGYWEPSENRLRAGDVNEILAWIEYCVLKRLRPDTFEKSIVAHLRASCQKEFTFKQIDIKVEELWKSRLSSGGSDGEALLGHTAVYHSGTKALLGRDFSHERAQIVKARVQELVKQPIPEYAKRSSHGVQKKRKVEKIGTGDVTAKRLFKRKKTSHLNSYADTIPRRSPRLSISVQIPPNPSRTAESVHARTNRRSQSAVPKCEHERSPTVSPISSIIEDSQSPSPSWYIESPEDLLTTPRGVVQRNRTRLAASPLGRSAGTYLSCNQSECEKTRQLHSECEGELQILRGNISEARHTIEELQAELASEKQRQAMYKTAARAPTDKILTGYLTEIEILRSQILDKEVFVPFTTRDIRKHMPFDEKYFQNNMFDIKNDIDDFMCRCSEMSRPCNEIKLEDMPEDLLALLYRVLGESRDTLQAISFHSLLRSILSAAVCEWVLECDFQEPKITGCPLRDTMLSHLTSTDGEDVARNLDFAAHHTLIESEEFQDDLIPRRAEALATRLSDGMEPLFSLQNPLDLWEVDILKEWQRQRSILKKIFVSALRVKTKALVSKDIFEVIFPAPGCEYDPEYTDVERLERDFELGQSPIVRLCLVPGLRKFAYERKLVDYNSFRRPSASSAEPGDNIASPLVIPE